MSKQVFVGMSGGVDSSLTAALLQQQGYRVKGVYMKNWSRDLPSLDCPWRQDYLDAKRVAVQLGIPFGVYDFEQEYRSRVVDYMLEGYRAGLTPNPDIMCNQEIKFKLFLDTALADGADMIATGHYARVGSLPGHTRQSALFRGVDGNKDQTYFLYRVNQTALQKVLMPLGGYTKPQVRAMAQRLGLATAGKKDSQGICFVGKVGIKDFLLAELGPQPDGPIVDSRGRVVGRHDGAIFYTIGQRHGLDVGGGLPYYVVGKDMSANTVYVTTDLQDGKLWGRRFVMAAVHWINQPPQPDRTYGLCTRYRAAPVPARLEPLDGDRWQVAAEQDIRALSPGQSAVVYDGDRVVGGGILAA